MSDLKSIHEINPQLSAAGEPQGLTEPSPVLLTDAAVYRLKQH